MGLANTVEISCDPLYFGIYKIVFTNRMALCLEAQKSENWKTIINFNTYGIIEGGRGNEPPRLTDAIWSTL